MCNCIECVSLYIKYLTLLYNTSDLFLNPSVQLTWVLYVHREPDSTYFELPPGSQPGQRPVPSTSTPGSHHSTAEGSMDVYHLRDMNDNVMVGTWASSKFISYHFVVEHVSLFHLKRNSSFGYFPPLCQIMFSLWAYSDTLISPFQKQMKKKNQLLLFVFVIHFLYVLYLTKHYIYVTWHAFVCQVTP